MRRLPTLLLGLCVGAVIGATAVRRLDETQQRFAPDRLAHAARRRLAATRGLLVAPPAAPSRTPLAADDAPGVWHGGVGPRDG